MRGSVDNPLPLQRSRESFQNRQTKVPPYLIDIVATGQSTRVRTIASDGKKRAKVFPVVELFLNALSYLPAGMDSGGGYRISLLPLEEVASHRLLNLVEDVGVLFFVFASVGELSSAIVVDRSPLRGYATERSSLMKMD